MAATILIEIAGVLIVVFALREVFHDIFHPIQSGALSDLMGRTASTFRHTAFRPTVGPLALVSVIFSWVVLVVIGFALIYFPLIPAQIRTGAANPGNWDRLIRSLSWSLGALGTFKTFDMRVEQSGLQVLVAFEGLVGISLITASISWLVLLYPALERMRFLARRTFVLVKAVEAGKFARIESDQLITEMADQVIQARIDLILFPLLLSFYPPDPETLAAALPHLQRIAGEAMEPDCSPQLRLAGSQLRQALIEFCEMLSDRVLSQKSQDMETAFQAFAARSD